MNIGQVTLARGGQRELSGVGELHLCERFKNSKKPPNVVE